MNNSNSSDTLSFFGLTLFFSQRTITAQQHLVLLATIISLSFLLLGFVITTSSELLTTTKAFAQLDTTFAEQNISGLHLYIPDVMLVGETYYGIIVSKAPAFATTTTTTTTTSTTSTTDVESVGVITNDKPFFIDDFVSFFNIDDTFITPTLNSSTLYPDSQENNNPAQTRGQQVYLAVKSPSTSTPSVIIQSSSQTIIPYGMNHGIFEIKAVQDGMVQIHASHNGKITTSEVATVYSLSSGPRSLDLILPGDKTSASNMLAGVMIKDGNGYPVKSPKNTEVHIVSSGFIKTPDSIIIPAGQAFATFPIVVQGNGDITAISATLQQDTESIQYTRDTVSVKMAVAPNVALPGGTIQYTVWLERDNRPFYPPQTIRGELQTTNTDAVRFTAGPPQHKTDNTHGFVLRDGIATGKLYVSGTGLEGGASPSSAPSNTEQQTITYGNQNYNNAFTTITAIIPEYGTSSADVCIGAVGSSKTDTKVQALPAYQIPGSFDANGNFITNSNIVNNNNQNVANFVAGVRNNNNTANTISTSGGYNNDDKEGGVQTFREYVRDIIQQQQTNNNPDSIGNTDSEQPPSTLPSLSSPSSSPPSSPPPPQSSSAEPTKAAQLLQGQDRLPVNHLKLWLYPNVTSHATTGIIGFYHAESKTTRSFEVDSQTNSKIETNSEFTLLSPVKISDNHHVSVSAAVSGSVDSDASINSRVSTTALSFQPIHITQPNQHTNMYTFPILSSHEGTYSVSVTSKGATNTNTLQVAAPHKTHYKVQAIPLPILPSSETLFSSTTTTTTTDDNLQKEQPIFLLSITDNKGRILDIYDEFGQERTVRAIFSDGRPEQNVIINYAYNTGILRGNITDATQVTFTLKGKPGTSEALTAQIAPVGLPVAISMSAPSIVHVGEIFPLSLHLLDTQGVPIERISTTSLPPTANNFVFDTSTGFAMLKTVNNNQQPQFFPKVATDESLNSDDTITTISALHNVGGSTNHQIAGFLNPLDLTITTPPPPRTIPAGESFELQVAASSLVTTITTNREDDFSTITSNNGNFVKVDPTRTEIIDGKIATSSPTSTTTNAVNDNIITTTEQIIPIHSNIQQSYRILNPNNDDWTFTQVSPGKFNITANSLGDYTIIIQANLDGYTSNIIEVPFSSKMSVPLYVGAISADETPINIETEFEIIPKLTDLKVGNANVNNNPNNVNNNNNTNIRLDGNGNDVPNLTTIAITPYSSILTNPAQYSFAFPEKLHSGHTLVDVRFQGGLLPIDATNTLQVRPTDEQITVTAVYENRIQVLVVGGLGSGTYQYGESVQIQSTPQDIVPFLLPSKLSYWDGAPGGIQTNQVLQINSIENDLNIFAIYEPDFTRILYVALVVAAAVGILFLRKFGARIMYSIGELMEYVREPKEIVEEATTVDEEEEQEQTSDSYDENEIVQEEYYEDDNGNNNGKDSK